jgi:drug/metabolite transporter (DMT)-like permease
MLIAATVTLAPLAAIVERPGLTAPGARTWSAMLALAVLSTAIGYVVYFRILATAGPTNLLLATLLMPVGGVVLGAAVLGERPSWTSLVGMLVIVAGLAIIDGRLITRLGARRSRLVTVRPRSGAL